MVDDPIFFLIRVTGEESGKLNTGINSHGDLPEIIERSDFNALRRGFFLGINLGRQPFSGPAIVLKITASTPICQALSDCLFGTATLAANKKSGDVVPSIEEFPFRTVQAGTGIIPVKHDVMPPCDLEQFLGDKARSSVRIKTLLNQARQEASHAGCNFVAMILPPDEFAEALKQLTTDGEAATFKPHAWGNLAISSVREGRQRPIYSSYEEPENNVKPAQDPVSRPTSQRRITLKALDAMTVLQTQLPPGGKSDEQPMPAFV